MRPAQPLVYTYMYVFSSYVDPRKQVAIYTKYSSDRKQNTPPNEKRHFGVIVPV